MQILSLNLNSLFINIKIEKFIKLFNKVFPKKYTITIYNRKMKKKL